ncbi:MAG: hypothetical protein R2873_18755 [Caldilineaceae bacterium]
MWLLTAAVHLCAQSTRGFVLTLVFLLLFALSASPPLWAATNVSGPITTNTTWTLANSPYIVTDDVTVEAGVTLTIQPGVVVKFDSGTDELWVNGTLIADASGGSPSTSRR